MTRIEEIYETVLPEMKAQNIEDTTEHRLWFLQGLKDGWLEDEDTSVEKSFYVLAVTLEILRLGWMLPKK